MGSRGLLGSIALVPRALPLAWETSGERNVGGCVFLGQGQLHWLSGNEGVGEHVRTNIPLGDRAPVKLRTSTSAPNEETCFFCRTGSISACSSKIDPAV